MTETESKTGEIMWPQRAWQWTRGNYMEFFWKKKVSLNIESTDNNKKLGNKRNIKFTTTPSVKMKGLPLAK